MNALSLPSHGSVIVFEVLPLSSWATVGERYRVNVRGAGRKAYVHLTNVRTGSSTFDRGFSYSRGCVFRTVEG